MKGILQAVVFTALLPLLSIPASACSFASCGNHGIEMRREFVVMVKHQGKPLAGVSVQISRDAENVARVTGFSGVTGVDGTVPVTDVPAGDYWLNAELLGIKAAYHCFHVAQPQSRKAKGRVTYEWGDLAPATRRIAGSLIDSQPGKGGTPLWNFVHPVKVPISGARLRLQNPITGEAFNTASDQGGVFAFDQIPSGTYVLHAEGGRSDRDYDGTDLLIRLSPVASRNTLVLTRRDAIGGSCGGTLLDLLNQ